MWCSSAIGQCIVRGRRVVVIEADESDGTIALYEPTVSVLTNISLDHKPMAELERFLGRFARGQRCSGGESSVRAVDGFDAGMKRRVTFGVDCEGTDVHAADVALLPDGVRCVVNGYSCRLRVPGRHNVANAVAAVAACGVLGISVRDGTEALGGFSGDWQAAGGGGQGTGGDGVR